MRICHLADWLADFSYNIKDRVSHMPSGWLAGWLIFLIILKIEFSHTLANGMTKKCFVIKDGCIYARDR